MEKAVVHDALDVKRGMMRTGSSAKRLGFCCQKAGQGRGFLLWFRQTLGGPG